MLKKLSVILISIVLMINVCGIANAADLKTSLDIIQKASETKDLENDQGFISKTIVDSDSEKGEVTIELKLSNTKKDKKSEPKNEIVLLIDKSGSMENEVSTDGTTRKDLIFDSAAVLAGKLLDNITGSKVGVASFSSAAKIKDCGTINDAKVELALTDKKADIIAAAEKIKKEEFTGATNIEAGLKTAEKMFSKDATNRVIVLLTDGIPNCDVIGNYCGNRGTGDINVVKTRTKQALIDIEKSGVKIISLMSGVDDEDDQKKIEEVFGTKAKPTAGKFYNIADSDISKIVQDEIYKDVMSTVQFPIDTVKIVDYFPEDIIENFEFSYVGTPNFGTTTDKIDPSKKTITWDIEKLKGDEVATLKYKLKIKSMQNTRLLNKVLSTNQKVVLTYTDKDKKNYTVELTTSPKIELKEIKEEKNEVDSTIATKKIPQTGVGIGLSVAILSVAGIIGFAYYKSNKFRNM